MIDTTESLVLRLRMTPASVVRDAIGRWASGLRKHRSAQWEAQINDGWDEVQVGPDEHFVHRDGIDVPVVRLWGRAFALPPAEFQRRRQAALEQARVIMERDTVRVKHTASEALAATTCPQIIGGSVCGCSLQQSGICPSCALGKSGYRYRYSCESCGYDIATREPL